nr:MAG TPA: hypothetical protein [Crassvirales sp.]
MYISKFLLIFAIQLKIKDMQSNNRQLIEGT